MFAVFFVAFWCVVILYLTGLVLSGNTADEEREANYFSQPGFTSVLRCYSCEFRHEVAPGTDTPLYCPRCGLPLDGE